MVDQIDLTKVDGKDVPEWALERTLQDVRDHLNTLVTYYDSSKEVAEEATDHAERGADASETTAKATKETAKATRTGTHKLSQYLKAQITGGNTLGVIVKRELQKVVQAIVEGGGDRELDAEKLPIIGIFIKGLRKLYKGIVTLIGASRLLQGVFGALAIGVIEFTKFISKSLDQYRSLYDAGQTFGGSLGNLMIASGKAGVSLTEFSNIVREFSQPIKSLTSETKDGAMVFAEMGKEVRAGLYQFGLLGMTTEQINGYLGEYLETAQMYGQFENISRRQQTASVIEYTKQLTRLSQLTGKEREEIAKRQRETMRDVNLANYLNSLGPEVRRSLMQVTAELGGIDETGALQKAMSQFAIFGQAIGDEGVTIAQLGFGDEFADMMQKIKSGYTFSNQELSEFSENLRSSARLMPDQQIMALSQAASAGAGTVSQLNDVYNELLKINPLNAFKETTDPVITFTNIIGPRFNELMGKINRGAGWLYQWMFGDGPGDTGAFGGAIVWITKQVNHLSNALDNLTSWLDRWLGSSDITPQEQADAQKSYDQIIKELKKMNSTPEPSSGADRREFLRQKAKLGAEKRRLEYKYGFETLGGPYARGGIAKKASIFGEAGPEAAIPLDRGQRIPIAEIKGDFNKKELMIMIDLMKQSIQRQETIAVQQVKTTEKIEKLAQRMSRVGNTII